MARPMDLDDPRPPAGNGGTAPADQELGRPLSAEAILRVRRILKIPPRQNLYHCLLKFHNKESAW